MSEKNPFEDPKPKRTTVKSYASRVFKESSVGMVSSIAHTSSKRRKAFKTLALILCLSGFLYQSGKFLSVAFQYPTTVDVDIIRPQSFNKPAYTFCDNNGIKRSMFCKKFPDYCEEPDEEFCETYEYYCGENKTLVPKMEFYSLQYKMNLNELIEFNGPLSAFLLEDESLINENPEGPYFRPRTMNEANLMCYTLNGRVNSSKEPLQTKKNVFFKEPTNVLTFYIEPDETFVPGNRPGVLFSIHSPFEAVNPLLEGIFMKPGRTYVIHVSMEEEVLLQKPYQTDCVNYSEIWENNNKTGPRTQEMCRHKCFSEISMACFNCVIPLLLYPTQERLCDDEDKQRQNCPEDVEWQLEQCEINCKDDCRRIKYHYDVQERFSTVFRDDGNIRENHDQTIRVHVYMEEDEIIVLKHSPKYMIVEVFSSIGGFIGCWLGISLLDIADIFEGFVRIFRYSFKRR